MACSKYVEAVFGAGLVSSTVMDYLCKDLVGDLASLLASVYAVYGGSSYQSMIKSLKAKNIVSKRLPENLDDNGLDVSYSLIFHIMLALSNMSENRFVEWFTRDDLSHLEKLKVKRIVKLFLEVQGQV
jgi:hypothetical protein